MGRAWMVSQGCDRTSIKWFPHETTWFEREPLQQRQEAIAPNSQNADYLFNFLSTECDRILHSTKIRYDCPHLISVSRAKASLTTDAIAVVHTGDNWFMSEPDGDKARTYAPIAATAVGLSQGKRERTHHKSWRN